VSDDFAERNREYAAFLESEAFAKEVIKAYGAVVDRSSVARIDMHPLDLAMVKWSIRHYPVGHRMRRLGRGDGVAGPIIGGIELRVNNWLPEDLIAMIDGHGGVIACVRLTPHAR
jgi:hypothetical protein